MTEEQLARASIAYYVDSASGESEVDPISLEDGEIVAQGSVKALTKYLNQEFPKS